MPPIESTNQEVLPLGKVEKFGLVILTGLLIFLVFFSLRCNVHYYDSYEYFNNTRELLGIHTRYDIPRPPCFSLILLPFAWLAKVLDSRQIIERSPYFIMLLSGLFTLLIMWRMMRSILPGHFVMVSILALAFNVLFLHFWVFPMPEILACFLLIVYWRAVFKHQYLLAAIMLGLIFNLRYQLLPLGVLGFLYTIITEKNNWPRALKNWTFVAIISLAILFILHYIAIVCGAKITFTEGLAGLTDWLDSMYLGLTYKKDRGNIFSLISLEVIYLLHYVTAPVLLVSFLGMLKAKYRREKLDWIFIIWFWGVYLPLGLILEPWRKEARYFIIILPPIYYFFSLGLMFIWSYLSNLLQSHHFTLRRFLLSLFLIALLLAPLVRASKELIRLWDKNYTRPVGQNLAKIIKPKLAPNQATFWIGSYYTIAPYDFYFSIPEKFFFFNLFSNGLSFYLEQPCFFNYTEEFIYQGAVGSYAVVNRNLCQDCGFINNFNPKVPLTVHKIENQTKYYRTNKTITRNSGDISTTLTIFASEKGDELYLTEVANQLIIDKSSPQPNTVIQFIFTGERVPLYPDPSFFGLPSQVPLTPKRKIANIEFVFVSEISAPIGEVL